MLNIELKIFTLVINQLFMRNIFAVFHWF